jgi:ABC-type Mn2+/Zn2+ transport system permease subunit
MLEPLSSGERQNDEGEGMPESGRQSSWLAAYVRGLIVFLYFVIATVWLPDRALQFVDGSSRFVQDAVVSVVWFVALAAGLYGLRRAQSQGLI